MTKINRKPTRRASPTRVFAETGRYEEAGYVIRKRQTPHGKEYIQVDLRTRQGKRIRTQTDDEGQPFSSLGEAITFCRQKRAAETNQGTEARNLSSRDRLDAVAARQLLGNTSILEAAEYYVSQHGGPAVRMPIQEVYDEYLEHLQAKRKRPSTIKGYRDKLKLLLEHFENTTICDIARSDIEAWLQAGGWNPLNEGHYLAVARSFMEFARKKGYIATNPCVDIDKPTVEPSPPEIQTPAQISKLFAEASKLSGANEVIPYLALHYFAGLRPKEAYSTDWKNILFDEGLVRIGADVAKARRQRLVEISPNLTQWLSPFRKKRGRICTMRYETLRRRIRKAAENAEIETPYDAGRHAFASYHLAAFQDIAKTSLQLGHSRPDLLLTTYRGLVTQKAAIKFWKILPPRKKNVVAFPQQVA